MNPYIDVKRQLGEKAARSSGVVVAVEGRSLRVRLPSGVATVLTDDATAYRVGDTILVDSGTVRGKLRSQASITVYQV